MPRQFVGFPKAMQAFFRGLKRNNTREWFGPRKHIFEESVRRPMVQLVTQVNDALRRFAVDNVVPDPAKAIYRIYRDTRFSKDKTPYKTHIGATFGRAGLPKHAGASYYFGVSDNQVELAGGVYMPGPEELTAIRAAIVADPDGFLKVARNRALTRPMGTIQGDKLKRVPREWADRAPSPVADYLKFKSLYWYVVLPASLALGPKIASEVIRRFRAMRNAMEWFNRAILTARAKQAAESRPLRPEPMW